MGGERSTRRRFLQGLGGVAAGSAAAAGATEEGRAESHDQESWPQPGYDAANTRHAPDNTGPVGELAEQWSFGRSSMGSPTVAAGVIYDAYHGASSDHLWGRLFAVEASDGSEEWSIEYQSSGRLVSTSPAVVDGTVYVGSDDYKLYALDAADGTQQWSFPTDGYEEGAVSVAGGIGAPTVADGTVYVGGFDRDTSKATAYAVDATTGSEQWTFQADSGAEEGRGKMGWSPAVANGTVYIASTTHDPDQGTVYALDAGDGTEQWHFETGDPVEGYPTIVDGTVYVASSDGNLYALNAADGTEQWTFQKDREDEVSSPAVADGTVYVESSDGNVYALDAADGTEQWSFQTGAWWYGSPAVVDGIVYVAEGDVYALDAEDGTEKGSFHSNWHISGTPAVVDGTIYVGGPIISLVEASEDGWVTDISSEIPLGALGAAGLGGVGAGAWWYLRDGSAGDE